MDQQDHPYHRFAENLAAAWISAQLGIGLEYALKTYVRREGQALGESWYVIAEQVSKALLEIPRGTAPHDKPPLHIA